MRGIRALNSLFVAVYPVTFRLEQLHLNFFVEVHE